MPDEDWKRARQLAEHQHWLVSSEQLRTIGLTPNQIAARLRGGSWAALLHGVYLVDADMYDDVTDETWWRAALLAHGPSAMLVGRTGARALGAQGLPLSDPAIEIGLVGGIARVVRTLESPGRGRDAPRVVVRQLPLLREDVVVVQGLRVRRALPTIIDAGLQLDRAHALALLDSALHLGLVDDASLAEGIAASSPRRGCRKLQEVGTLADGRAESPLESRVRLACIDGDLAPDELQYEVKNAAGSWSPSAIWPG